MSDINPAEIEKAIQLIKDKAIEYQKAFKALKDIEKQAGALLKSYLELSSELPNGSVVEVYRIHNNEKLKEHGVVVRTGVWLTVDRLADPKVDIDKDIRRVRYSINAITKAGEIGTRQYIDRARRMPLKGQHDSYDEYYIIPTGMVLKSDTKS